MYEEDDDEEVVDDVDDADGDDVAWQQPFVDVDVEFDVPDVLVGTDWLMFVVVVDFDGVCCCGLMQQNVPCCFVGVELCMTLNVSDLVKKLYKGQFYYFIL